MTEEQIEEWKVVETLQDAGCNREMIAEFLKKTNNAGEMLLWLVEYRNVILEEVHKHDRELECLDFLLYKIRKAFHLVR